MTRDEIQQEGVQLAEQHNFIIYEYATSVGKSLVAILVIEKDGGNWNIVLAETNHELNWINEFKKHGKEHLLKQVTFFCYQSLHKFKDGENYIFDEIHHCFSDKRLDILHSIYKTNLKRLIGLSATLTKTQKELLQEVIGNYHIHKVSLSEAIDWGILPEPTMYFIGIELDDTIRNLKYPFGKDKFIMTTQLDYYNRSTEYIEKLKLQYFGSGQEFDKIKWLSSANKRKKFLSVCKTPYARILLDKLSHRKLICFTGSIEQSKELSGGLSIHSKISKEARIKLLNDFNEGIIDKLFATGMLKESVNLAGIEIAIIIQLDNVERSFLQISGRSLRSIAPEVYVLYVKNTQDETYVKTVLENFNMDYVKFVTMEEL